MCSCNLQGTQVKETGRYLHTSDLSLFLKRGQIFKLSEADLMQPFFEQKHGGHGHNKD